MSVHQKNGSGPLGKPPLYPIYAPCGLRTAGPRVNPHKIKACIENPGTPHTHEKQFEVLQDLVKNGGQSLRTVEHLTEL
jgi:hypothetical protein